MPNEHLSTQLQDDPYAISQDDAKRIKEENDKKSSNRAKVKWHSLPQGEGMSNWRILPFIKRRTFFVKVLKHFSVPGMTGSVTCPRSFEDPNNPGRKYPCAICEKFFELLKSKEPGDVAFAKQALKQTTSYYANGVNLDKIEDGVGVFNMPYAVWNTLYEWLDIPEFREFSHPKRGRNIKVKAKLVPGTQIPGKPSQEKRDYLVIPEMTTSEIADNKWLEQLYDLDAILGIPTYEFTQSCLEKLLTNDATAGQLPQGTPFYIGQLPAAPTEQPQQQSFSRPSAPPSQLQGDTEIDTTDEEVFEPAVEANAVPKFAQVPTATSLNGGKVEPTTTVGLDNHRICFGTSFDEDNKICLKCPENDACELKVLKAARGAKKSDPVSQNGPASTTTAATPTSGTAQSEAEIRELMMKALTGKK